MIRIPTRSLFLTCTERPFLLSAHNIKNKSGWVMQKKQIPYLERRSPFHGAEFPSSQVPCLKSTAFMPLTLPSPPHPFPAKKNIYLHKDDINMPAASVEHSHNEYVSESILAQTAYRLSSHMIYIFQTSRNSLLIWKTNKPFPNIETVTWSCSL
jgi:hypothetical protein